MGKFLRENWLWILAPVVIVLALFLVLIFTSNSDDASPFIYNIF